MNSLTASEKSTSKSPHRIRSAIHCARVYQHQRDGKIDSSTSRTSSSSTHRAVPLFATVASLPGLPETTLGEAVLDRFCKKSVSPHDPTTLRRTAYTLISNNCTQGERRITYLVELTEVGPNVRPCFPVIATATPTPPTSPLQPTDLRVTTAPSLPRRTVPGTFSTLTPRVSSAALRPSKE